MICKDKNYNTKTFIGDVKKPIAIGKKGELWSNLDDEFYNILELWRWHESRLLILNLNDIDYPTALGIRYLAEVNK